MSIKKSRPFLSIEVKENRIEIREGMFPFAKKKSIPLRNIAGVDIERATNRLVIHTNDGKTHKYAIGGSEQLRDAILEAV